MRVPMMLVTLALLAAGCTTEEPTTPAAEDDADPVDPWPEGGPSPTPGGEPARPTPTPTSPTPASPTPAPTSPTPPVEDEPAAPAPIPWTLNATLAMGYVAGVGAGSAQEQAQQPVPNGVSDPSRCSDAAFTVPLEATSLVLVMSGAPAEPNTGAPAESGAGMIEIRVTAPDGTVDHVAAPAPGGADPISVTWTAPAAMPGAWTLHAYPVGPAAQQTWDVAITVAGASLAPPTALAAGTTC